MSLIFNQNYFACKCDPKTRKTKVEIDSPGSRMNRIGFSKNKKEKQRIFK
jgi:hypothetical protein